MIDDSIPQKQCRTCEQWKPATTEFFTKTAFYQSPDGLNKQCKVCRNAYRREHNQSAEKGIYPTGEKKRCSGCNQEWPATLEFFSYRKATRDRLSPECKTCANKRTTEYRARPGGKEARQAYRKATYDPGKRKARLEAHREEEIAHHKRYYATHKEQHKAYAQAYMKIEANKEAKRVRTLNRIARKKAIPGTYTTSQIREQLERQKHKCYYCSATFEKRNGKYVYHIDHTFPLSRVSNDIPANDISYLVLTCPWCNTSKGDKFPWEWPEGGRLL